VESLDVTHRDAFLALAGRHDISDIVHLAGTVPDEDPVRYFRTDTTGLLNALDAARTWGVRRFAVASSLDVYAGRTETCWHEELALPNAALPHLIIAFKKAVEPLTAHSLHGSGVQPFVIRIGTIWGPRRPCGTTSTTSPAAGRRPTASSQTPWRRSPAACGSTSCPDARTAPATTPYLDTTRLARTGFAPTVDVATAVADYVVWRADNPR
jgi:nucleoside-diphosphate-sugar epimerase